MIDYLDKFSQFFPESTVIPKLYWNSYSQEQRIHTLCNELAKMIKYSHLTTDKLNEAITIVNTLENQLPGLVNDDVKTEIERLVTTGELAEMVNNAIAALETRYDELSEKVNELSAKTLYVDDFGAVGDGFTNDTAAIQSAFDTAAKFNSPVAFTRGKTYLVNPTASRVATNGTSVIEWSYGAIILKARDQIIFGNGATVRGGITQSQYDANAQDVGAVFLVTSSIHDSSKIGQNNSNDFVQIGQHVLFDSLTIDGGAAYVNQTAINWAAGRNNLPKARGISSINQNSLDIELKNTNIINTIAEGMSGGSQNTSCVVRGGYFAHNFPSALNLSGGYELLEGCIIENDVMCLEMNPTYPKGNQIVRNCTFTSNVASDNTTYIIGCAGLNGDNPENHAKVFFENNTININTAYLIKQRLIIFRNLNELYMRDNVINYKCDVIDGTGYGAIVAIEGNMNSSYIAENRFYIDYPPTSSRPILAIADSVNAKKQSNDVKLLQILDISGTSIKNMSDVRALTGKISIPTAVPTGSTTMAFRMLYMNNAVGVWIKSSKEITLSNFNIRGFASDGTFKSLLESNSALASFKIPTKARYIPLVQIEPNASGESLFITADAINDDVDITYEFILSK